MDTPGLADFVDQDTAHQVLLEATRRISADELEDLGRRLERKASLFRETFRADRIDALTEGELDTVLCHVFSIRTRRRRILAKLGHQELARRARVLLYGVGSPGERLQAFVEAMDVVDTERARSLGSEILHFTTPNRTWLWTPWIWNPKTGKGVLPVLTTDKVVLGGETDAERYDSVGRATMLVAADGHQAGYGRLGRGLLGCDAFLATCYAVTLHTLYVVNISQEFKRFLPELPEMARRLLGIQHI